MEEHDSSEKKFEGVNALVFEENHDFTNDLKT
jgi:hypothetical protein